MLKHIENLYHDNSIEQMLIAAGLMLVIFAVLIILRYLFGTRLKNRVEKTDPRWGESIVLTIDTTKSITLLFFSIFSGMMVLEMSHQMRVVLIHLIFVIMLLQLAFWSSKLIYQWIRIKEAHDTQIGQINSNYSIVSFSCRLLVWIVVTLLILSNLGVNISTLVASLGIGGVAVALALQNVLGDLFASLAIMMDKPFQVGDYLSIGEASGTVRHIGLKTTRLESLTGEELVFANSDLLKTRIHNYKQMKQRRISYTIGIDTTTPVEKLPLVNDIVSDIFKNIKHAQLRRSHFSNIGQSTYDYEIVYYVLDADYAVDMDTVYMDIQQELNLGLVRELGKANIVMPFPTQAIQIQATPELLAALGNKQVHNKENNPISSAAS